MTFDQWWTEYPLKKGRREAEKAYLKLTESERAQAHASLPLQIKEWQIHETEKRFMPRAATWLNQGRFDDEYETEVQVKQPDWWTSPALMDAKARELGISVARPGESEYDYKNRIRSALGGLKAVA